MHAKLGTINKYLARAVFAASVVFSLGITMLAAVTGDRTLLIGTMFGIAAAAYSVQVLQPSSVDAITGRPEVLADAA